GILPPPISMGRHNNVLSRNQSPSYFGNLDYGLQPIADPTVTVPVGTPQDNLYGRENTNSNGSIPRVYFTVSRNSPSRFTLPGKSVPSGANIVFDPNIAVGGNERLFAFAQQLGLTQQDDIDGLALWDDNDDGVFNGTDEVLFSLTRDSPTLRNLGAS